ncbi:MAG: DUF1924 domain-containing protein [Gammaproteobacteria bacterium]|nr:DUF1924 domain-containing protein [Gammaproteobacteria bacterium]
MKVWILVGLIFSSTGWAADAATSRLDEYAQIVKTPFSAQRGQQLWIHSYDYNKGVKQRSCASCHGEDLSESGKHVRTGKTIKPMSRLSNPSALTDEKKIEKWFTRNCKWTMGRECSVEEKGDILTFLLSGAEK